METKQRKQSQEQKHVLKKNGKTQVKKGKIKEER
jgi:hypothetical protein